MTFPFVSTCRGQCLSDAELDRLVSGQLADAEATALRRHAAYCLVCRRRLAEFDLDHRLATVAAIPPIRAWPLPAIAVAVVVAAALVIGTLVAQPRSGIVTSVGWPMIVTPGPAAP